MTAEVTMDEALAIAGKVDRHAGGYFKLSLARAALMGAELQREKDRRLVTSVSIGGAG